MSPLVKPPVRKNTVIPKNSGATSPAAGSTADRLDYVNSQTSLANKAVTAAEARRVELSAQLVILRQWAAACKSVWQPLGNPDDPNLGDKYVNQPPYLFQKGKNGGNAGKYAWAADIKHRTDAFQGWIFFKGDLDTAVKQWETKVQAQMTIVKNIKTKIKTVGDNTGKKVVPKATTVPGQYITKGDLDALPVLYNVGSVREAYFAPRSNSEDSANAARIGVKSNDDGFGLNSPSPVTNANELWTTAIGSKGMLQTYFPPNGWGDNTDGSSAFPKKNLIKKYGFQFLYNPTTIAMSYFGTQQTDVAYQMSGNDKTNFIPQQGNSGGISFDIIVNRMYDMKYYDDKGKLLDSIEKKNIYAPRNPYNADEGAKMGLFNEQAAIYNKGTMYDVEYLLRTLTGFTMKSQLRREMTADMGIFSRRPVELHLGPKMRYRGYVNGLSIRHIQFNERMVPIVSAVHIEFNRYPDYPDAKDAWVLKNEG